jgi:Tol biopolymer transport system component
MDRGLSMSRRTDQIFLFSHSLSLGVRRACGAFGLWELRSATYETARSKSAAWSPDGKSVVFTTRNGDITIMGSDGTHSHLVANLPYRINNFYSERLAWSPDGNTIRFDRNNRIYEIKPDGSGLHPFLHDWHRSSALCCGQWTPDGRFFEFLSFDPALSTNADIQPETQIWALDESRRLFWEAPAEPVQLTSGPIRWHQPIPGKDGKKIFASGSTAKGELVRLDAKSDQLQSYLGGISAEGVSFSPDGRFIAYVSFPEGILWRANRDGGSRMQLTDPPLYPELPHWSPDGTQILFSTRDAAGNMKAYLISSQGASPQPILPEDEEGQWDPNWSPDGRKIAFDNRDNLDASARVLRILDLASHEVTTVPESAGMISPRWSPDGRFLVGLSQKKFNAAVFDFETQRWSAALGKGRFDWPVWSRDGRFIYFLRMTSDKGVFRVSPSDGKEMRVVDLTGFKSTGLDVGWMALDPDDRPMLLRDAGGTDIYALTLEEK